MIFLDACVLFPHLVRALLLGGAEAGLYCPLWSARVLEEWRIAALRRGADEVALLAQIAAVTAAFPDAEVPRDDDLESVLDLPDPADVHVAAAAISAGAETLITFNLRDFPTRKLAGYGLVPRHPDGFLWEMFSHAPDEMGAQILQAGRGLGIEDGPRDGSRGGSGMRRALKRASLPRLGKAWEAQDP